MKRFVKVLTVALTILAITAFSAMPAFAGGILSGGNNSGNNGGGPGSVHCQESNGGVIVVSSVLECNALGGVVIGN